MIYELIICNECDDLDKGLVMVKAPLHEIVEKNISIIKCENGHETLIVSDSHKFEDLIYFAFSSFQSNFFHQTIANITSAYEMLQEMIIEMVLLKKEIDSSKILESLKKMKLSERRFGGFYYLFLSEFNTIPTLPSQNKEIPFRNKVIHNGYICNKKETFEYMIKMFNIINKTINDIQDNGFDIRNYIINNTALKSKEISDLREVYIWNIDLHKYIGLRDRKENYEEKEFTELLNNIPDFDNLVISQAFREKNIG